ncbi:GNAT family N-acetyltransferase [Chelativorans salis]|uniref:GNAT family N-acetyltransferase n=1 Tax=Chelativorans salis TaxID=2978478 RepID=A0ABT2LUR1_9HYPH|nr:GNAT family N-acetyltransferase [Chelativorans sp. EGI FJ00035]MCT7378121.1 GNAT family N-acetyltransferase [Chelativorans sp. EGI FJ00035]
MLPEESFPLDAITVSRQDIREADLTALHALSVSVSWPHRAEDWQFLREYGEGYVAVDASGRVHASAMWFPFGKDFATIGMVITSPRLQANGGGKWLMQHVLEQIGGRALGLHATRDAYRLYRSYSFSDERTINQHQGIAAIPPDVGPVNGGEMRELRRADHAELLALDKRTTGTNRSRLLSMLVERSEGIVLYRDGELAAYALARLFGRGTVIGPVLAANDEDAATVVRPHIAARIGKFVRLDTGATTGTFTQFLTLSGLPVYDTVTRMSLGRQWPLAASPEAAVYALAAQATG